MNKKFFLILFLISLAGPGLLFGHPERIHKRIVVEKDIHIGPHDRQDNIILLGGSALIEGLIEENVVALGGRVTLSGTVQGDVIGLGAQVYLKPTAAVEGDVVCIEGTLEKDPGCRIEGDTNFIKLSHLIPKFEGGWRGFMAMSLVPFILVFKLIMVFIWILITVVMVSVIPHRVTFGSEQIRKNFGPVLGTGVLGLVIYILLVIMAALLCIILIGIPILLALLAAHFFITIFGQVAVYHFFGDSLAKAFGNFKVSPLGAALLGLLLVSFLTFIPFLGLFVSLFLNFLVFGVAIRTKFGSTENWFQKRTV
jgi:hypothetical protein